MLLQVGQTQVVKKKGGTSYPSTDNQALAFGMERPFHSKL